jgi:tetratricopeptide (TPR) repeat protein
MTAHVVHWKLAGRTLAPLELNEVMYTLELGIVTAGFVFMAIALLSVLIFGRFFCSWGCHILALEDLCAWLLGKIGIRPKPVRSRVLLLVPPAALFYMFIWPQISRLIEGRPMPQLRVTGEESAWASYVTDDFWRNLPGPVVIVLTFAVVGFVIVYFLGTRSFCRYGCPYGALFALADRVAPGNIVARGDCTGCGHCTAQCQSNIRVHEELSAFGKIVSPSCLKDLDCVAACTEGNIGYGFTTPTGFKSFKRKPGLKSHIYDFTLGEEVLMASVFILSLLILRGLYGLFPFLLMLGLGAILAYAAVLAWRLAEKEHVRFNTFQLKLDGRITRTGMVFAVAATVAGFLLVHSGVVRYHELLGGRALTTVVEAERTEQPAPEATLQSAITHLSGALNAGLLPQHGVADRLAAAHLIAAERSSGRGEYRRAAHHLRSAVRHRPDSAHVHYNLAVVLTQLGEEAEAMRHYERSLALDPTDPEVHNNLGFVLAASGDHERAEHHLRKAIELDPDFAHPHFNLGRLLLRLDRPEEAAEHLQAAARLDPFYADLLQGDQRGGGAP